MRKLASIQRIKSLEPIEGADSIEKAIVLGWQLVVKKGEYKAGDMVVYCEIDSLLPDKPEFQFLKPKGMRIRTIRLRGQISQGICFPLTVLPKNFPAVEGVDCTEAIGITKYEPPIPASLEGIAKGKFPSFIPKTDEPRVQTIQHILDRYRGTKCYITEKIDGSSVTYFVNNGEFGVCSRNLELLEDNENTLWKVARELDIENKLRSLNQNIAIQGELVGEGIQSNKLKLRGQTVKIFNVFDIDKYRYLDFSDFVKLCDTMDLPIVPLISTNFNLSNDINSLIETATRKSLICPDVWAEGIVIRDTDSKTDKNLLNENMVNGRLSFKVINPEFLLKYDG